MNERNEEIPKKQKVHQSVKKEKNKSKFEKPRFMSIMLDFLDKHIEQKYKESFIGYQRKYFRFFQISSFFVLLFIWFLDPLNADHYRGSSLMWNLINGSLNILVAIYFYFKRNFSYPDYAIFFLQLYTIISVIESNFDTIMTKYSNTEFITTTLYLETVMLTTTISRCSWKINFFSSLILNIYLNFRYTSFSTNSDNKGLPTLAHVMNAVFITLWSYSNEKFDRIIFFKRYNYEQSVGQYEQILREVLPTSIVIYKNEKIMFCNVETAKLLNIKNMDLIEDSLRRISVSKKKVDGEDFIESQKNENEIHGINENMKSGCSIFEYFSDFVISNKNRNFISLTGILYDECVSVFSDKSLSPKVSKYFEIKLGKISWEGNDAVMVILSEDFATQRLIDLQEQANYKDKLLATVSHNLRTPLNGVVGTLDLALEGLLDKSLRKRFLFSYDFF